jgi:hypothetical protein
MTKKQLQLFIETSTQYIHAFPPAAPSDRKEAEMRLARYKDMARDFKVYLRRVGG